MRLYTAVMAGLVALALTIAAFGSFSANAQSASAVLQIAQADPDDPAVRLQEAILALKEARKGLRAAKQSGKGVNAAQKRVDLARDTVKAARRAALAAGQGAPAGGNAGQPNSQKSAQETGEYWTPERMKKAKPMPMPGPVVNGQKPRVKTGIADDPVDPRVQKLREKLRQARRQARDAERSAAEAHARAAGGKVVNKENDRVIIRLGDKVIVRNQNESERFLRNARDVVVVKLPMGRTRTIVTRPNGVKVITITNRYGEIVRRLRRMPDGREVVLIDNTRRDDTSTFNVDIQLPRLVVPIQREQYIVDLRSASGADIEAALTAPPIETAERVYSLEEVRRSERLRNKVRRVDLDTITFRTASAAIGRNQISTLTHIGDALEDILAQNPNEIFLVEGHTDAVGSDVYNLALSDQRAESVAIVLSETFEIPPENLVTQGYGEEYLKIPTLGDERRNRRVTIRRITPLIRADAQ